MSFGPFQTGEVTIFTTILSIFIGSFLVGAIFVPALQKLREGLIHFSNLSLPFEDPWEIFNVESTMSDQEKEAKRKAAVEAYNRLYREYVIHYRAFIKIAKAFYFVLFALVNIAIFQLPIGYPLLGAVVGGNILLILFAIFLKPEMAPSPEQLVSIDYMANHFAKLHFESAIRLSEINAVWMGLLSRDQILRFTLRMAIVVSGFRILFAVTDENEERLYFLSYGLIGGHTQFQHVLRPEESTFLISLGNLDYEKLAAPRPNLKMRLYLFIPTPIGWVYEKDHPRVVRDIVREKMDGMGAFKLESTAVDWDIVDQSVSFRRKQHFLGWEKWTFDLAEGASPLLSKFVEPMSRTNRIKFFIYESGKDLKQSNP